MSTSISVSSATPASSKLAGKVFSIVMVAAIVVAAIALFVNSMQLNAVAADVTAKGGNGRVQTYGAEFNMYITSTSSNGVNCTYKPFWNDGTQIGSGFPLPCTEEGYQSLLEQLHNGGKITDAIYNALKTIKFW